MSLFVLIFYNCFTGTKQEVEEPEIEIKDELENVCFNNSGFKQQLLDGVKVKENHEKRQETDPLLILEATTSGRQKVNMDLLFRELLYMSNKDKKTRS